MPKIIATETKEAILKDLLDLTKTVEEVVVIYKDVCSKRTIYTIGTEYGIDWNLRTRLINSLVQQEQLNATILDMKNTLFNAIKNGSGNA